MKDVADNSSNSNMINNLNDEPDAKSNINIKQKDNEKKEYEGTKVFPETLNEIWLVFKNEFEMKSSLTLALPFTEEEKTKVKIVGWIAQSVSFKKELYYSIELKEKDNFSMTLHFTMFANTIEESAIVTLQIFIAPNNIFVGDTLKKFIDTFNESIFSYLDKHKEIIKHTESTIIKHNIKGVWELVSGYRFDIFAKEFIQDFKLSGDPRKVGTEVTFTSYRGNPYKKIISLVDGENDSIKWRYGITNITGGDRSVGCLITMIKITDNVTFLSYEHSFTANASKENLELMSKIKKDMFNNIKKYLDENCKYCHKHETKENDKSKQSSENLLEDDYS